MITNNVLPPPRKKRKITKFFDLNYLSIFCKKRKRKRKRKAYITKVNKKIKYTHCIIHDHSWICDIYECKGIKHRHLKPLLYKNGYPSYIC
jgi:hypothetical protein